MSDTLQDLDRVIRIHLLVLAPVNEPEDIDQSLSQSTVSDGYTGIGMISHQAADRARPSHHMPLTSLSVRHPQKVDQSPFSGSGTVPRNGHSE